MIIGVVVSGFVIGVVIMYWMLGGWFGYNESMVVIKG